MDSVEVLPILVLLTLRTLPLGLDLVAFPGTNSQLAYINYRLRWHNSSLHSRTSSLESFQKGRKLEKGIRKDLCAFVVVVAAKLSLAQINQMLY